MATESTVKKALTKHYSEKYALSGEDEMKAKVEAHLKGIIAPKDVSGSNIDDYGYKLMYDSFSEGLEPIYFWIVDFMRDTYWGTGLEVKKTLDRFEASSGGAFFGDLGTRASIMQDRAMKLMGTINTVVRSVINIIYDLKEFDQRLQFYKDLQSDDKEKVKTARLALKQFWMDRVDVQRGRASLNMLAQQLQFVTLRDAFMYAENVDLKGPDGNPMDLNDRVIRILKPRIADYLTWERISGKELERRYKIERIYLESQVESLKLYAQWAKPYFQVANELSSERTGAGNLLSIFNTLELRASLLGTKEVKKTDLFEAVEVSFVFRTIPHTIKQTQTGTHYAQGGKVEIQFRGFALSKEEKDAIDKFELHESLQMAKINERMIKEIEDSLKTYLTGDKDEEFKDPREKLEFLQDLFIKTVDEGVRKKLLEDINEIKKKLEEKSKGPGPFEALFDGIKEIGKSFGDLGIAKMFKKKDKPEPDRKEVAANAKKTSYVIYNVYKKGHGMFTE